MHAVWALAVLLPSMSIYCGNSIYAAIEHADCAGCHVASAMVG